MLDKTILITGCSSGIGYETARMLKERGCRVLATARKSEDVERLLQEGYEAHALDLNDSASIQAAVDWARALTDDRIQALFHNGAYGQAGALEDLSRAALQEQFETNLFGWHELNNLILPLMRKNNEGTILFNSSVLGLVSFPFRGAYNASKFAVEGYADTLRLELADTPINIVLIEPGPIRSRFRENAAAAFMRHVHIENSPHKDTYTQMQARLNKDGDTTVFTLGSDAVADKVIKALSGTRPKPRYYVTFPTYLFGFLRHVLPTRVLDAILRRA